MKPRLMYGSALRACVFFALAGMALACSPVQVIKMKPMRFVAIQTPEGPRVELADAPALFDKATAFLKKKKYAPAALRYRMLLKYYPKNAFATPTMYNLGMCLVGMKDFEKAAKYFKKYLETQDLAKKDRCDGMEKLGDALSKAGMHEKAVTRLGLVQKECVNTPMGQIRVAAKLAHEHNALNDPAMAMKIATGAMRMYRINKELPGMRGYYYAAMAYYEFARAYEFLFDNIKLYLPMDRMQKDLTDKSQYFLSAQSSFLNAIRVHNTYFGIRAGMEIGRLYEIFYKDLMAAEVPAKLTVEQRGFYFEELKKQIRPLVQKAEIMYQENLRIGKYYNIPQKWMQETRQRLDRLKALLREKK